MTETTRRLARKRRKPNDFRFGNPALHKSWFCLCGAYSQLLQQTSQERTRRAWRAGIDKVVKRNVLLIRNCGNDGPPQGANGKVDEKEKTFDVLSLQLHDIDLAVVDLGANLQSLTIVESLSHSNPAPPVIALVDEKNAESIPELHRRGAAACLKKPFCADELARLIEAVCASPSH